MRNLFLAKSNPKETIIEHTENLLNQYQIIKQIYPNLKNINWDLLYLACLYHDLGKMNTKFQNKIMKNISDEFELLENEYDEIEEIPHGYLSNAFIPLDYLKEKFTEDEIKILYESIFYHHNREKLEGRRKEDLLFIINNDLNKYVNEFKYNKLIPNKKLDTKFNRYLRNRTLEKNKLFETDEESIKTAKEFVMTKGLLNKIDYAASSDVTVEYEPEDLVSYTEKSISKFGLNRLQEYMKKNQDKNLIIKASTGIGKTEGALLWIGNNKGFFTLPLRVSINSIYDRIIDKNKIGHPKEKTALLHSDTASEYIKRNDENILDKSYLNSTKQLSLPLTVCTLDQLIGFIFKYEGFELKLATLSYSKIVIDEIQMYSSDMVAYLILALRDIISMEGKFAIVTATFPEIFEYFMNYVGIKEGVDYVKPKEVFLKEKNGKVILRHKIKVYKENINSEIICRNSKDKKVLVIVNTVKAAQRLYKEIDKKKCNVNLFHSKYTKEDRAEKEKQIFKNGQLSEIFEGIWITTQVVEASLDIDFDILYTELSDMSGLLQRMGRVYRNRELDTDTANIHVFVGDNKKPSGIFEEKSIIDIDIFNKSKEVILNYNDCKLDEAEKMKLVDKVYSVENLKNSRYFANIKQTITDFNDIEPYNLNKNESRLRDISSELVMPEIIYNKNKEYIEDLINRLQTEKDFSEKIKIKEKIMKKTLSIPSREIDTVRKSGGYIKEVQINKFESIKIIPFEYSFEIGLEKGEKLNKFNDDQFI